MPSYLDTFYLKINMTKSEAINYVCLLLTRKDTKGVEAVGRAMVALYKLQTVDEQRSRSTRYHNNQGFSASDAYLGSYYARWVLRGQKLSGNHLEKARKMALKYRKQLARIVMEKFNKTDQIDINRQGAARLLGEL